MIDADHGAAREQAKDLKKWLGKGGFYPPTNGRQTVDAELAKVLHRTAGTGRGR